MRVVSLIPSISETLMVCDANLVGRSRFCIHPEPRIKLVPAVAGTKQVDWGAISYLQPELVVLDKEENTREMAADCPYPYLALHITSIDTVASELLRLAGRISNGALQAVARRWKKVGQSTLRVHDIHTLPGLIEWWRAPTTQTQIEYLIWRDPWMAIGEGTFIHAMLNHMGMGEWLVPHGEKYPQVDLSRLNPEETILLFSTEPFPFHRYRDELMKLGFACGLIDGESYSWYGVRSLRFLETIN